MITILLTAHNEKEAAMLSVESIRESVGDIDISVILVDNASTDGLQDWAVVQTDISYVYMDQGLEPWGSVLAQVCREFQVDTDIVLMRSGIELLPGALEKMAETLKTDEKILAVGPLMPLTFNNTQWSPIYIKTPQDAVDYMSRKVDFCENISPNMVSQGVNIVGVQNRVLGLDCGFCLFKSDFLTQMGGFDDSIWSLYVLSTMNALKIIKAGGYSVICEDAVVWCMDRNLPESADTLSHNPEDLAYLEHCYGMHYFNISPNQRLVNLLDISSRDIVRVLEIGCDCGATLNAIKKRYPNTYVCGCDLCESAISVAEHFLDEAFTNNIEKEDLPIEEGSLDYIIFGDVLEHLHDPAHTLRYVRRFLRAGGKVIASIPNLMHISVIADLLCGNFTYTETGLLDKTHIHFFTFNEIIKIFPQCGYRLEVCQDYSPQGLTQKDEMLIDKLMELGQGTERFMYTTFQYQVRAIKSE